MSMALGDPVALRTLGVSGESMIFGPKKVSFVILVTEKLSNTFLLLLLLLTDRMPETQW